MHRALKFASHRALKFASQKFFRLESWKSMLTEGKVGGFAWWKSFGLIFIGLIMAWAMSHRYGDSSNAWATVIIVFFLSIGLLWWSHSRTKDTSASEDTDEEQG